jgi:3-hydroxy acid dehydrogenase/malonic semialdehyde reductase
MTKTILITGATSGIGKACALKFASNGYRLILTGRRKEKLAALKNELITKYNADVLDLCFDVQEKAQVEAMLSDLKSPWNNIDILLNNAGLALGRDSFEDASMQDWETMLQTNVNGLLYVSKTVLPYMIERKHGHVINIGSIAGKEVYENGNVYCASKFAVDAISKSMRIDLLKHNIKVTAIHPGAVETEFSIVRYKGDEQKANATYKGFTPLTGEDIADTIFYAAQLPEHVCINELTITCAQQASATNFFKKS